MTKTNRLLLITNTLLALILVLVIVQVATPNANAASSTIAACANKKTGVLRLATPACTSSEKKVNWGIAGPAGARGPAGAQGPAGSASLRTKEITYYNPLGSGSCFFGLARTYSDVVTDVSDNWLYEPIKVYKSGSYVTNVSWDPPAWSKSVNVTKGKASLSIPCTTITVYSP